MGKTSMALAAVALSATVTGLRAPLEKPNIVMMFVDDLGYGDLGFTGHPTTRTPNFDKLASKGKVLSSWYSGCPVCSGSRSALMTGRQFVRLGVPGVFRPTTRYGLNTNETSVAKQLKKAGYKTAAMGKWHLGQRKAYLPAAQGFDRYLGIPYSDDMGDARTTSCNSSALDGERIAGGVRGDDAWRYYLESGHATEAVTTDDPASKWLPLVHQQDNTTTVVEQPLDFTTLGQKYRDFAVDFVRDSQKDPFFLYMPFSHVHATAPNQPGEQYAGCAFKNQTKRGEFGDALMEADWIGGEVIAALEKYGLSENTLVIFSSDNGPWLMKGLAAGSPGIFTGRSSQYWNTGKGSTWEGGVREPAFAYWPGQIGGAQRTSEVVSSLDLFPTVSHLAGVPLPAGVVYDGRDATDVILGNGKSKHEFLFLYGGYACDEQQPSAVRYGKFKAHFATGPGVGGCSVDPEPTCKSVCHRKKGSTGTPLLFNVDEDPSESYPLSASDYATVIAEVNAAFDKEVATGMTWGTLIPAPDGPGEGPGTYGVCCSRAEECDCNH